MREALRWRIWIQKLHGVHGNTTIDLWSRRKQRFGGCYRMIICFQIMSGSL